MIKVFRKRTKWLYHPVTIFLAMQVLWVLLMVLWVRWYLEKHAQLREMAAKLRTDVDSSGWLPLLEGGILLALILAGATIIFIYWNKQHRLNATQRAFVSNVTHELKSPVASIQLALETLALRDLSPEARREFLSMMLDDTDRLNTLIERILGAARIERHRGRYQLEPISLRSFIDDLLDKDRHLFEKDGHVVVFEKGGDARVAVDPSAMRAVLSNLLENAARYSPRGSVIRMRLQREMRHCRLEVIDTGEGIPRQDLRNVFKMFWRGGESTGLRTRGTGLGLYIVRNIVRDHGGKVWAYSAGPGRGTTFTVRLPRLRPEWARALRKRLGSQPKTIQP
jgi:signal transduction histidine kinase